jgi:hypothetical protein
VHTQDAQGNANTVQITIDEPDETGTLSILSLTGKVVRKVELTRLKKNEDGTKLFCNANGAAVTVSLKHDKDPPELHVSAILIFTILDSVYHLHRAEYLRLAAWIKELGIGSTAGSA